MFYVVAYINGKFDAVISGMGRNKGTWDGAANSLRNAQRWAKQLLSK